MKNVMVATALLFITTPLFAHREDYLGETLVFLTLERHAVEPEFFADVARHIRDYNAALEYGITDRTMVDGRVSWDREGGVHAGRLEGRHRFGDEGIWPVDVAVSLEANFETDEGRRHTAIEPRLILSKDVERFNVTVNLAEEIASGGGGSALRVASGVRFDASRWIRVGNEFQYDLRDRRGAVVPQLWLTLPHEITVKAGYFASVHGAPHFIRAAVEFEF